MEGLTIKKDNTDFDTMQRMAAAVAKSRLFGVTDTSQALSLMLISQAEGRHPALAAKEYHVIKGRPTLSADAMLARFQQAKGKVEWLEYSDEKVIGVFTHEQGGSITIEWTFERAKKAGLTGNPVWTKYTRNMLRSRCVTEGVRAVYPAICTGIYTEDEVESVKPDNMPKNVMAEVVNNGAPTPNDLEDFKADMIESELWEFIPKESIDNLYKNPSFVMIDAMEQTAKITKSKKGKQNA